MNQRILIVDDNPTNLRLACSVLEFEGYVIDQAVDAAQAIEMLNNCVPDLILMDISLPDIDGLTLTRRLKFDSRFAHIPIVALTAFAMKGDDEKAREAGCSGYITKPINTRDFPAQIGKYLSVPATLPVAEGTEKKPILIVDDYPANLRLLRAQLEAEGYAVLEAANGIEALKILESAAVVGIVSDILMPGMDGYRLCLEVRKSERFGNVPLVLYTSTYNSQTDRELAKAAGADAYIAKPAPTETILAALQTAAGSVRPAPTSALIKEIEAPLLKQYSEVLVRKLEEKNSELGRAYEGLALTEARLSGMVESALDAIITVNSQQQVVLFNGAAEKMFKYPRAAVLGKPVTLFMPPGHENVYTASVTSTANSTEPELGIRTTWALRSDGTQFPIEVSVSKLLTSHGELHTAFIREITERYEAEQALTRSEAGLRQAQEIAKLAHFISVEGKFENSSSTLSQLIDCASENMPESLRAWLEIVHPDDREKFRSCALDAAQTRQRSEVDYRLLRTDSPIYIHHVMDPMDAVDHPGASGIRWFNTLQDISEQKKSELHIRSLNRILAVLSGINNLIVRASDRSELFLEACRIIVQSGQFPAAWIGMIKNDGKALQIAAAHCANNLSYLALDERLIELAVLDKTHFINRAFQRLLPQVLRDAGSDPSGLFEVGIGNSRALIALPILLEGSATGVLVIHAEATGIFNDEELKLLVELASDISFALDHFKKAEQISFLAHYDPLTTLPNRRLFCEQLALALRELNEAELLAVVLIDIERFRNVNETWKRAAGDELLLQVAARLQSVSGSVARIGIDVFAIEIRNKLSVENIARAVEDLSRRCFGLPFTIASEDLRIGSRAGIAVFPSDGADAETLLKNSEAALRRAKVTLAQQVFYAPDLNARAAEALSMESRLRRAIERNEFVLYYQPKVGFSDRQLCGVEALIRWQDPERGLVAPGEFIPVLEVCGLIGTVGEWALHQALTDQLRWRAAGFTPPRVAVNISALQLGRPDFAQLIVDILATYKDAALELEITESMIMENVDRNIATLKRIRAAGVHIAVDDFGTGYCSLSYIAKLPITSLKIDRSFVVGMTESPEGLAIVSSIIALAHALKLKVVAEGIETEEQARQLHLLSCNEAQGYLFSRPVPFDEILELLRTRSC